MTTRQQWRFGVLLLSLVLALSGCFHTKELGFDSVQMVDETAGWGVIGGTVYVTADGGRYWRKVLGTESQVSGHCFLDRHCGWILTDDGYAGTLYRTGDDGKHWTRYEAPFRRASLQFPSEKEGWAVANLAATAGKSTFDLYQTVDGGSTWKFVPATSESMAEEGSRLPLVGLKESVSFRDSVVGCVSSADPSPGPVRFYITRDGGRSWQRTTLPVPDRYAGYQMAIGWIGFMSSQEWVVRAYFSLLGASGLSSATVVLSTADAGLTWSAGSPIPSSAWVAFLNSREGWAISVSQDWVIYRTGDGGKNWEARRPTGGAGRPEEIKFVTDTVGWVTSYDQERGKHLLFKTIDGGKTWLRIVPRCFQ